MIYLRYISRLTWLVNLLFVGSIYLTHLNYTKYYISYDYAAIKSPSTTSQETLVIKRNTWTTGFQSFKVYWQNQQKTCFWPSTNTDRLCYGLYIYRRRNERNNTKEKTRLVSSLLKSMQSDTFCTIIPYHYKLNLITKTVDVIAIQSRFLFGHEWTRWMLLLRILISQHLWNGVLNTYTYNTYSLRSHFIINVSFKQHIQRRPRYVHDTVCIGQEITM